MSKVVLITGASSGIGKSIGEYLALKGMTVYGTSRDSSRYLDSKIKLIDLDVKSESSIQLCVNRILKEEKKIDVLINNAGVGITGPLEEIPQDQIINNFKTNFYGPINLIKEALPIMRNNNSGMIINITSVAAYVGTPFRSIYSASKAALDLVSETLNMETKNFNVNIVTIAPGEFATDIASRRFHSELNDTSPYYDKYSKSLDSINTHVNKGENPIKIAKKVFEIINCKNPKKKYIVGSFLERISPYLKLILPQKIFEKIIMNSY